MNQSNGTNKSERYLADLCRKCFLNLWSYPNLFTDEGKKTASGDGKELCDLLVVFGNHVIIFSVKDISFKNTGNLKVDWARWVRRAVYKNSASQVYGAEKFILEHPNRIFTDKKCTEHFPLVLPSKEKMIIHRVIVAPNATKRFQEYVGGSGSLSLEPSIVGEQMKDTPFTIGTVNSEKGFIHVFDDVALDVVLYELDTVVDFVTYLFRKEELISKGRLIRANGEEELLAAYLATLNDDEGFRFAGMENDKILVDKGCYSYLKTKSGYANSKVRNEKSYLIDHMIDRFAQHTYGTESNLSNADSLQEAILGLQVLASEDRLARRALANTILDKAHNRRPGEISVRFMKSPCNANTQYVLLILELKKNQDHQSYQNERVELLNSYCYIARLIYPERKIIVGIGLQPPEDTVYSEDMLYIDTDEWTNVDFEYAKMLKKNFNIPNTEDTNEFNIREFQYPDY